MPWQLRTVRRDVRHRQPRKRAVLQSAQRSRSCKLHEASSTQCRDGVFPRIHAFGIAVAIQSITICILRIGHNIMEDHMGKYFLAWLLGVPAGLLVLIYLFTHIF